MNALNELSKKYDIKLSSRLTTMPEGEYIDISVSAIEEYNDANFLKKLLRKHGRYACIIDGDSLIDSVNRAISILSK